MKIKIEKKENIKKFIGELKFPIYFLDFESITKNMNWLLKKGLSLDQQISSFSFLKINSLDDDETKIKHFSFEGKEDYPLMTKKLTDFYKSNNGENGTIFVWSKDLELSSLSKLMKSSNSKYHKKISHMLANIVDLQKLFHEKSFIKFIENEKEASKSSLKVIADYFGICKDSEIKNGRIANEILIDIYSDIDKKEIEEKVKLIEEYNNSDVINIKRILVKILELI